MMDNDTGQPGSTLAGDSDERQALAQRLREAREYLGFSQEEVAQSLNIPRSALSNIETGQRRVEAVELKRFAALYRRPLGFFTGDPADSLPPLPEDVAHLARKASNLSKQDRDELSRFADFLRTKNRTDNG
jgi:transcriptional regulator with XRE-family HTH domain